MRIKQKWEVVHRRSKQVVKHVDGPEAAIKLIEKLDPNIDPTYGSEEYSMEEVRVSNWSARVRAMVEEATRGHTEITSISIVGARRQRKGGPSHEFSVGSSGRVGSFVNVYEVTRHYGGPEEGGWWYDWYELIHSYPTTSAKQTHNRCLKAARRFLDNAYGDTSSVLGGTQVWIRAEATIGKSATTHAPHYE